MINKLLSYLGHSAWGGVAAIVAIIGLLIADTEPDKKENSTESYKNIPKIQSQLNKIESTTYNNKSPNNWGDSFGRFSDSQADTVMTHSLEKNIEIKNTVSPIFGKFKEKKVIIKSIPALASKK